jgi:hypothetical protein
MAANNSQAFSSSPSSSSSSPFLKIGAILWSSI